MPIQNINTGSSANAGNGDSIRLAFDKVNRNFSFVQTNLDTLSAGNFTSLRVTTTSTLNNLTVTGTTYLNTVESASFYNNTYFENIVVSDKSTLNHVTATDVTVTGNAKIDTLDVLTSLSVGSYQIAAINNYDDFSIVKNDATGLAVVLLNTNADSNSKLVVKDNISGGLAILHQNVTNLAGDFVAGENYIYGETPTDVIHIGAYSDIKFSASQAKYYDPSLPETPSMVIQSIDGAVHVYSSATFHSDVYGITGVGTLDRLTSQDLSKVVTLTNNGSLVPSANLTYDLGSTSSQWRSLYVGTSTIYLGGTALSVAGGNITINGNPIQAGAQTGSTSTLVNGTYTVSLSSTGALTLPGGAGLRSVGVTGASGRQSLASTRTDGSLFLTANSSTSGSVLLMGQQNYIISGSDISDGATYKQWAFGQDGSLTFPDSTVQSSAYPGVLVPANGDGVSGSANLVFYDGAWNNTSKVGINPTSGFLTLNGTGGAGGIRLPNAATISVVDIGFSFISTSNGPGGVAVQQNSLTVGIANPTVIAELLADPTNHRISFNGGLNNVAISGISGPQGGTNIYTITGTWPANATGFPITITSNDYVAGGITKLNSDNGVNITTAGGSWQFGVDGASTMTIPGNGIISNEGFAGAWELDGANGQFTFPNSSRISYGLNNAGLTEDDLKVQAINTGNVVVSTTGGDWTFGTDGRLTLPQGGVIDETPAGETLTLAGAGLAVVNQTYTKTSLTLYTGSDGVTIEEISPGVWFIIQGGDTKYSSADDLITWSNSTGGLPVPTGTINTLPKTVNITVGTETWAFGGDGDLAIPPGKTIRNAMTGDDLLAGAGTSTLVNGTSTVSLSTSGVLTIPGSLTLPNGAKIRDTAGDAVAFGQGAGQTSQGNYAVAIGYNAGVATQGTQAVAIGINAGVTTQGNNSVAIGPGAGASTQGTQAVAIGTGAGETRQGNSAVAVGYNAGLTSQGNNSVAIGNGAGQTTQGRDAVAIGWDAGKTSQGDNAVAMGRKAGDNSQGTLAVAIGEQAGMTNQGQNAVAIGRDAGYTTQGTSAVAVGNYAGYTNQAANTIILNATGLAVNGVASQTNSFYVAPIRTDATPANVLYYNTTTKEVTYGAGGGGSVSSLVNGTSTVSLSTSGSLTLPAGGTITEDGGITGAIRLTPAGGANAYQALLIYPTAATPDGDHLHLTAGGGTTELYLGNDLHYVKLVDGGDVELRASTANYSTSSSWTFGTDGRLVNLDGLTLTAGGQFNICTIVNAGSGYDTGWAQKETTGGSGTGMTVGIGYGLSTQLANVNVVNPGTGYVNGDIITVSGGINGTFRLTQYNELGNQGNNNFVQSNWTFGTDGMLTFPGGDISIGTIVVGPNTAPAIIASPGNSLGILASGSAASIGLNWVDDVDNPTIGAYVGINPPYTNTGTVLIGTDAGQWIFGTTGSLTFPNATVQTTAWTGIPGPYADDAAAAAANVAVGNPYHKTGTSGQVFVRLT